MRLLGGDQTFVGVLLSSSNDEAALLPVLRCLGLMAQDELSSREIGRLGGLPLLLSLLHCEERRREDGASGPAQWSVPSKAVGLAVCTGLTRLVQDEENAVEVVRKRGLVCLFEYLLLPCLTSHPSLSADHAVRSAPSAAFCVFGGAATASLSSVSSPPPSSSPSWRSATGSGSSAPTSRWCSA